MNELILDNVSKSYGPLPVLEDVSLRFEAGSVHALLGPNGSGKTTLFRILLGLTSPTSGSVSVPDSRIGCGFQQPRFYEDLTVEENLQVFASLAGTESDWVDELRTRAGLDAHRDQIAGDLSDGLGKKLDFALAFVDRPDVSLLDEPFADVDDEAKPELLAFLDSYRSDDRIVVITTHQLHAFEDLLDTLTVVVDGSVVFQDHVGAEGLHRDDLSTVYHRHLDGIPTE